MCVGLRRGTKKSKQNKMFYLGVSACVCECGVCLLVSVGTKQKKNKKATVDSSHIKSFLTRWPSLSHCSLSSLGFRQPLLQQHRKKKTKKNERKK